MDRYKSSKNSNSYVAIGDIHGCIKSLEVLMADLLAQFGTNRIYVFLGDYVDRGPHSKEVIDYLIALERDYSCVFLRGNHDAMLLNYIKDKTWLKWFENGGTATMESYRKALGKEQIPLEHLRFFTSTRLFYDTPEYFFVHGGPPIDRPISDSIQNESLYSSFLWSTDHLNSTYNQWEKTVIFGHSPVRSPIQGVNMIGIDTGCVYPQFGKLTAVSLPERDFFQQKRIDF
ncbi:MAG: metallophosphoesterase [Balneola sp.]|nr:metallophosphoesterase [Balneola sp.]